MKISLVAMAIVAGVFLASSRTSAGDPVIQVGSTPISIPIPEGFSIVTEEMDFLNTVFDTLVPHTNERLMSLIPTEVAEASIEDQLERLDRTLGIEILRQSARTVSSAEFAKVKRYAAGNKVQKQLPKMRDEIANNLEKNLEENFSENIDFNLREIDSLPTHYEADRVVSFSILAKSSFSVEGDTEPIDDITATTVTMVHVKARILFLYVVGKDSDLEWTREVAREWCDAIVKANPSDPISAQIEATPDKNRGIDSGIRGGIFGGLAAALIAFVMRSPKSDNQWLGARSDDKWFG